MRTEVVERVGKQKKKRRLLIVSVAAAAILVLVVVWIAIRHSATVKCTVSDGGSAETYPEPGKVIAAIGCGKWLKDNHNAETILSKSDDELRLSTPSEDGRSDCWKEFRIDRYISDGNIIDCGDKHIHVIATPGHTAGCMSYIFPVFDSGIKHMACLFGGTPPPWGNEAGKEEQKRSVEKFMKAVKDNHCDVANSSYICA